MSSNRCIMMKKRDELATLDDGEIGFSYAREHWDQGHASHA